MWAEAAAPDANLSNSNFLHIPNLLIFCNFGILFAALTLNITGVLWARLAAAAGHPVVVADAGRCDAVGLLLVLVMTVTVVLIVAEMMVERQAALVLGQHGRHAA